MAEQAPTVTRLEVTDGVAWLTLDRPDAANSRNQQMRQELAAHYDRVRADPDVRALVLTGAGDRFFCAGMDLREAGRPETPLARRTRLQAADDIDRLAALPVPTIAAINGYALGGGLEMALACDLRFIADTAQVGLPEVSHGLIPGGGATVRLPRLVGPAVAADMIFTGRRIDADRAAAIGLVNEVVAAADLHARVREVAAEVAQHPGDALRLAKEALLAARDLPETTATRADRDRLAILLTDGAEKAGEP